MNFVLRPALVRRCRDLCSPTDSAHLQGEQLLPIEPVAVVLFCGSCFDFSASALTSQVALSIVILCSKASFKSPRLRYICVGCRGSYSGGK